MVVADVAEVSERTAPTLGDVCADLGPQLVDVVVAPCGLDVPISGIAVYDPVDTLGTGIAAGHVVLAVGIGGPDDGAARLLSKAGTQRAAAVLSRCAGQPSAEQLTAAEDARVALLSAAGDLTWSEIDALLRASLAKGHAWAVAGHRPPATGDLLALADAAAAMAGGPVTIEDLHGRVLAFSADGQVIDPDREAVILSRQVPERILRELRAKGILDRLMRNDEVIDVRLPGTRRRRAIAIRAGADVLGAIWLAVGPEGASPHADEGLRQAAQVAAVQLLRRHVLDDLERRVTTGTVRMLLEARGRPKPMLERLGLPQDGFAIVAGMEPADEGGADKSALQRLMDLALMHLRAYRWPAAGTVLDQRVYVLVMLDQGRQRSQLLTTMQDFLRRACKALGSDIRAGLSEATSADELPSARQSAGRAIEFGSDTNRLVPIEEVHARALLAETCDFISGHHLSISPELRALQAHDVEHGSGYVGTLRAFLDAESDAARAARKLGIHVNTLRYRIRRIVEITRSDLSDPDLRLALEIQLRAMSRTVAS